jgi:ketosteroid isomerase-like protein
LSVSPLRIIYISVPNAQVRASANCSYFRVAVDEEQYSHETGALHGKRRLRILRSMSAENVAVVREATEAFMALDLERWKAAAAEGIELYPRAEEPGVKPFYRGMDGIFEYLGNWYSGWEEYSAEPVEFIDAGDYVVVDFREVGIAKGSGIRVEENFAHVFKVENGQITEWRMFGPVDEALGAIASK